MNATTPNSAPEDTRLLEASEWVLRLQGSDVDERTTAQWLEWCQAGRENLSAFEKVRALWHTFDDKRLSASLSLSTPGQNTLSEALSDPADSLLPSQVEGLRHFLSPSFLEKRESAEDISLWERTRARGKGRAKRPWAIAASLVLALGAAAWFSSQNNPAAYTQTLSTAVGSLSRQTLPDGSSVELGARSTVRVELTQDRRNIFIDDGEAFFEVAKDPSRPFVVQAGELQVIAVGTAFNVRRAEDRVVVTVREGIVRVAPNDADTTIKPGAALAVPTESSDGQVRAGAGHQVTYSPRQHSLTMTKVEPTAKPSAWQVGRLEFVNEPLRSVIADINRYSPRTIALADDRLGALVFTGTLRSDAINDWLRGLKEVFPVEVVDKGEEGILLTQRPRE